MRTGEPRLVHLRDHREIACTKCDVELISATRDTLVFRGKPPIEIATDPAGTTIMVCPACGNLVPTDADLLVVH